MGFVQVQLPALLRGGVPDLLFPRHQQSSGARVLQEVVTTPAPDEADEGLLDLDEVAVAVHERVPDAFPNITSGQLVFQLGHPRTSNSPGVGRGCSGIQLLRIKDVPR